MANSPPTNFIVENKDNDPVVLVKLSWDNPTDANFVGCRLHRDFFEGFVPEGETAGSGNCIVDEVV